MRSLRGYYNEHLDEHKTFFFSPFEFLGTRRPAGARETHDEEPLGLPSYMLYPTQAQKQFGRETCLTAPCGV